MPSGTVIKSVKDAMAVVLGHIWISQNQVVFLAPASFLVITGADHVVQSANHFIQNGARSERLHPCRAITFKGRKCD
ncbi:MAG: hypothetical protein ACXVI0_07960 [Halobacteriota archaeon]